MEKGYEERVADLEQRLSGIEKGLQQLIEMKENNSVRIPKSDSGLKGEKAKELRERVSKELDGKQGVRCYSFFDNGDVSSNSEFHTGIDTLILTDAIESERWFNAFAGSERVEILQALLKKSCTGSELMEKCGFSTTGKLYHHLNFLINTGIVQNDSGTFHLNASMVGNVLLMLLCASNFIRKLDK